MMSYQDFQRQKNIQDMLSQIRESDLMREIKRRYWETGRMDINDLVSVLGNPNAGIVAGDVQYLLKSQKLPRG